MAEAQGDERTIRFRLDGGRGYWVLLDDDADEGAAAARMPRLPNPRPRTSMNARYEVVGPGTEHKRALVLAPVYWDLQQWDESLLIDAIMKDTRGYDGGLEYSLNEDTLSTDVGVESFE